MHLLRIVAAVLGVLGSPACLADAGIYAFIDGDGQVHLSNIPENDRYHIVVSPVASIDAKAMPEAPVQREFADPGGARPRPYGAMINQVAGQYGIEAALLHAVISVESGYNAKAVSKRGAAGLMQLMPGTAKRYGVADVFDPADNVRGGARYLNDLLKRFGNNLQLALAAYNAGESAVLKYGTRIPPYRETIAYVPRVVDFYNKLRSLM